MLVARVKDVLADVKEWIANGQKVAVARVVGTEGSSPREPGATMAINELGAVSGSVSGGCVEGGVVVEALKALNISSVTTENGSTLSIDDPTQHSCPTVHEFGYSDDEAFSVGLTCGGTLRILIEPNVGEPYPLILSMLEAETPFVRASIVGVNNVLGGNSASDAQLSHEGRSAFEVYGKLPELGSNMIVADSGVEYSNLTNSDLASVLERDSIAALETGSTQVRHYGRNGQAKLNEVEVLIEVFASPPQMIIFGAVDFTAALARLSKMLGYRVVVCDARPLFATTVRFPMADEVVVDWPDRMLSRIGDDLGPRDAVCVLTHDPKFDVPAIMAALETEVGYIGAMGSRRTCDERTKRLLSLGVEEQRLERILGPIGLDIGARTPEETAVSIMGEIIAMKAHRKAVSLRDGVGSIHSSLAN